VADTDLEGLTARGTILDTDILYLVDPVTNLPYQVSTNALTAYFEQRGRAVNASTANQSFTTSDTYVTGSYVTVPASPAGGNRLQAKSLYRVRMQIAKTSAAGTATPTITVRLGTAGTTADTSRAVLTFPAQTAVADDGFFDIYVVFRSVGSGTSAVISASGVLDHRLASTGLVNTNTGMAKAVSAGFDSTVANIGIGISVNFGASFAGNTDLVQAELLNLA
jgi:hypothetical protein